MSETYKGNYTNLAQPTEEGVYRVGVISTITRYIDIKASSQEDAKAEAERIYNEEGTEEQEWIEDAEELESLFDADI
jgi:hypothetical protein|tara:strand:- start:12476 stop:12706 length:231 start_codon:yes stop_codon:yes gene_type:complete